MVKINNIQTSDIFDELRDRAKTGDYHPDDSPSLQSEDENNLLHKFLEEIDSKREFKYAPKAKKYRKENCFYKEVDLDPQGMRNGPIIDCIVLFEGIETWLIEVKRKLVPHMLGKLITDEIFYKRLPVQYKYCPDEGISKMALVRTSNETFESIFKKHDVEVKQIE